MELREYNRIKQSEYRVGKKVIHVLLQNKDFNRLNEIIRKKRTNKKEFILEKINQYYDLVQKMDPGQLEAMGADFALRWDRARDLERSTRPLGISVLEEDREHLGAITQALDITIKEFVINVIQLEEL